MDQQFLNDSNPKQAFRLETYRSSGHVSSTIAQQLRCYFISKCDFVDPNPTAGETDIRKVSDKRFLEKVSDNTLSIYQDIMIEALERTGPVVEWFEVEGCTLLCIQ
jgi:glutamate dehydrogenase